MYEVRCPGFKRIYSEYSLCLTFKANEGTAACRRQVGAARVRTAQCGMQNVISMILIGSKKCLQLQSMVPSDWTKKVTFLVT